MLEIDTADLTERLRSMGWQLSGGVSVTGALLDQVKQDDPSRKGERYRADVHEADYSHPTRGFCRHCGRWMRQLSVDEANAYNAALAAKNPDAVDEADPGHWLPVDDGATISCPDRNGDVHQLDLPLAVRDWRLDRWNFGTVTIQVMGPEGTLWAEVSVPDIEYGSMPTIDRDTGAVEYRNVNPLHDDGIVLTYAAEALSYAQDALGRAEDTARVQIMDAASSALAYVAQAQTIQITDPVVTRAEKD